MNRSKLFCKKNIKLILFVPLSVYLVFVIGFYLYWTVATSDPFNTLTFTYYKLIHDPIKRLTARPVASDELMIKVFYKNRKSFERLVEIHKKKCFYNINGNKIKSEEFKIQQKIGMIDLSSSTLDTWVPDPYSKEADKLRKKISKKYQDFPFTSKRVCAYGSAFFYYENYPVDLLFKGWVYFPSIPVVVNGELLEPLYGYGKDFVRYQVRGELDSLKLGFMESLTKYVYRQIEPQWFLFVCPGKRY
ncbi:MAG TPA: hypothetical protein ENJ60_12230 [Aeromonadales bacterium]|nr:hypothetical protein [Aeromonadales bacterium]